MYDTHATTLTASGSVVAGRGRIAFIYAVCGAGAGSLVLKDGGASGTTLLTIATPADATATIHVDVPGEGILCSTNIYLTLTGVTSCTVFYS